MEDYLPKQKEAIEIIRPGSPVERVLYGGAAGGGKSYFGCRWQIERRLKYAGTRGVIGRSELATLKVTTMLTFNETIARMGLKSGIHYTYNGSLHCVTFCNKSEIYFKDLFEYPSDANFDSLGSLEITDYFIDEASQVTKRAADILHSRCRFKLNEYGLAPRGVLTCNPSKGWVYNDIYTPWKMGSLPEKWAFIRALPGDNQHLPLSYLDSLAALPEYDRKRLLEGDWEFDDDRASLFKTDDLHRCFREEVSEGAERYISADVARFGKDRTVIAVWKGLACVYLKVLRRADTQEVVREIRALMAEYNVKLSHVIADEDGVGGGICDALRCRGFINGAAAKQKDRYTNQKAECYYKLASFIEQGKIVLPHAHRNDIIRELEMIRRHRPDADGKLSVTPKDQMAFSPDCFVAGTMVETVWGQRPIETIRSGDLVLSPFGFRRVTHTIQKEATELIKINGNTLVTKNHRLFTKSGLLRADTLMIGDYICSQSVINFASWIFQSLLFTKEKSIGFRAMVDTTTGNLTGRASGGISRCTGIFGKIITVARFLTGIASTILMGTILITHQTILQLFRKATILANTLLSAGKKTMARCGGSWLMQLRNQNTGTPANQAGHGTVKTERTLGKIADQSLRAAPNADVGTTPIFRQDQIIAPINAGSRAEGTRSNCATENANTAAKNLLAGVMIKHVPVVSLAELHLDGPVPVYSLTLENDNAYFANGLLSENCADALMMRMHWEIRGTGYFAVG